MTDWQSLSREGECSSGMGAESVGNWARLLLVIIRYIKMEPESAKKKPIINPCEGTLPT